VSALVAASRRRGGLDAPGGSWPGSALAAAVLGFFVITLDAVVVNGALPSIRHDLGGGITGLEWVVDGYTLMFDARLLSAGADPSVVAADFLHQLPAAAAALVLLAARGARHADRRRSTGPGR
jgi:MFS transporter, DHA2 family, methylenomycin A resistance protein